MFKLYLFENTQTQFKIIFKLINFVNYLFVIRETMIKIHRSRKIFINIWLLLLYHHQFFRKKKKEIASLSY